MDLYTSLVRLKMAMNDGQLPPMTPVPESSCDVIDPAFTIGYGALAEDAEKGLRCPLRGCGKYFHSLGLHIVRSHPSTSMREVREKLSIPQTAKLISRSYYEACRDRGFANLAHLPKERLGAVRNLIVSKRHRADASRTIGAKNLLDSCPTQLSHKIIDLHHKCGRTPTGREANMVYGEGFTTAVIAVFGTWNSAVAQCGLEARKKSCVYNVDDVLDALQAYYDAHGTLPSMVTARRRSKPLLPAIGSILRAFDTKSYPEAMRFAAARLSIYGGRYGLPMQHKPAEAA